MRAAAGYRHRGLIDSYGQYLYILLGILHDRNAIEFR